jgi:formylglycine-generating enzyme required for sulfatase activity
MGMAVACIMSLACGPLACSQQGRNLPPEIKGEVQALVKKSLQNMVFVKGGTFMMGDFGESVSAEGLPYTWEKECKPAHKVTLDSFSIARYKVTYADFDVYLKAAGTNLSYPEDQDSKQYMGATHPVGVPWQVAKDYCQWLGKQSGLPIDLPTEAQWEYAARSGGKFAVVATDNGKLDEDRNYPSFETISKLSPGLENLIIDPGWLYPVGKYPPNPLGLYDMGFDGQDWMNDWFDPDYYAHSPENNPQGPATGTDKVVRGMDGGNDTPMTFFRIARGPFLDTLDLKNLGQFNHGGLYGFSTSTVRCAIQSPKPQ